MSARPGWPLACALALTLVLDAAVGRAVGRGAHPSPADATATGTNAFQVTTR